MKQKAKIFSARKRSAPYSLHEPKQDKKELYVKQMKKRIASKASLKRKVISAFKKSCKALAAKVKASKLDNAVFNIAVRKTLSKVLKKRKESVGEFLACVRSVNVLPISGDDFGERYHTASSEPFFYDQSYTLVKHDHPIHVDSDGRCAIAEEVGDRDKKTNRPTKWRCTSECKHVTADEKKSVVDLKTLFQQRVLKLRRGLNNVDAGCDEHGHYTLTLDMQSVKGIVNVLVTPCPVPR